MPGCTPAARLSLIALGSMILLPGCAAPNEATSTWASPSSPSRAAPHLAGEAVDQQVNQHTRSTQDDAAIAVDPTTGRIFISWHSRRQWEGLDGVNARLYSAAGEPLTPEFSLHDAEPMPRTDPSVAFGPDGEAWAVWCAIGADGDLGSIVMRRYSEDFSTQSHEIAINQVTTGHQQEPVLAVNAAGEVLIAWSTPSDRGMRIAARLFDAQGQPLSDELSISGNGGVRDAFPVVAALPSGDFIIAWGHSDADGQPNTILAQRLTARGDRVGEAIALNDSTNRPRFEPSLAIDGEGRMLVGWMEEREGDLAVVARVFDAETLSPQGAVVEVARAREADGEGWLSGVAVAARSNGSFAVAYNQQGSLRAGGTGLYVRSLDARTAALGEVTRLTPHREGGQLLQPASNATRLAVGRDGALLAAWSGNGGFDDDSAVHLTRIGGDAPSIAPNPVVRVASGPKAQEAPIPPFWQPRRQPMPPAPLGPGDGPDFGFLAVDFTGWTPPDPELAVGPDHIVAVTNGAIAFFDKDGNNLFQDEIEGPQGFWGNQGATGFVFDPETLYDPHSGRFFAMANERSSDNRSMYLLAVSDDSNPLGTWHKYRIDVTNVDNDIDSPNMAVDADVVYLSADFFGPDKYQVLMIEKAPLLSGGAVNSREIVITGSGNQSMGIPIVYDDAGGAGFLLQSSEGTGNGITFSEVRFHAITNQLTNPQRVTVDVPVATYSYPNQPPQQGTSNRPFLFEPRFWSCAIRNGSLWAVHHVNESRARVRWYEFDLRNWPFSGQDPIVKQWGELNYGSGIHTYFPSIAVDEENNATIFFARSSSNEFISIGRAFRRHDDPLNTFRPMEFVKQSTAPYTAAGRWGDYSGTKPEPSEPGVFWGHHEWTDVSNAWRTWIAKVDTRPGIFELTGFSVIFGSHIAGDLGSLAASDNQYLRTRSRFGFTALEPNLMQVQVNLTLNGPRADEIETVIESRINHPTGQATVSLRRWSTNSFVEVGSYAIGSTDSVETLGPLSAADFVHDNSGEVNVRVKHVVIAVFTALGFDSFFDEIRVSNQ